MISLTNFSLMPDIQISSDWPSSFFFFMFIFPTLVVVTLHVDYVNVLKTSTTMLVKHVKTKRLRNAQPNFLGMKSTESCLKHSCALLYILIL